jgi:hypothetical protein
MKRAIVSLLIGTVLTIAVMMYASQPRHGTSRVDEVLVLPIYMIAAYISGNLHAPNEVIFYLIFIGSVSFCVYGVSFIFFWIRKVLKKCARRA